MGKATQVLVSELTALILTFGYVLVTVMNSIIQSSGSQPVVRESFLSGTGAVF